MECKENPIRIITKFNFRLDVYLSKYCHERDCKCITTIYRVRSPGGDLLLGLPGSRSWRKTTTLIKQLTKNRN